MMPITALRNQRKKTSVTWVTATLEQAFHHFCKTLALQNSVIEKPNRCVGGSTWIAASIGLGVGKKK